MNPRTSRLPLVATLFAMNIALIGCTDAFTVQSIIEKPDEPGARHDMHGLWVRPMSEGYAVLRIAPVSKPERACEVGDEEQLFLIADGPELRGHLAMNLSRVVGRRNADGGGWKVFSRVNPMPEPGPGAAPRGTSG